MCVCVYIYLKSRGTEKESMNVNNTQEPSLVQAEARNAELPDGCRGPSTWATFHCSSRHISKKPSEMGQVVSELTLAPQNLTYYTTMLPLPLPHS